MSSGAWKFHLHDYSLPGILLGAYEEKRGNDVEGRGWGGLAKRERMGGQGERAAR